MGPCSGDPSAEREEMLLPEPVKGPGVHWHYDVHLDSTGVIAKYTSVRLNIACHACGMREAVQILSLF